MGTIDDNIRALEGAPMEGISLFREGAFVMARAENGRLRLYNPLPAPVTAVTADGRRLPLDTPLPEGEERSVPIAVFPKNLRAFAGEKEACVYLAGTDALVRRENK